VARSSIPFIVPSLLSLCLLGAAPPLTCFGSPRPLSPPGASADLSFNFKESIATLEDGSVHAVWHAEADGARRIFYRRSPDAGRSWEPPRMLSAEGAEHPAIAASAGHVYVGWHRATPNGQAVVLRRSVDRGDRFEPPRVLSSSGSAAHVSLAADGPHVQAVWGDTRSGFAEIFVRSSEDGGARFSGERQLSDAPYESWVPNVDVHGDVAVAAWVDYRDANEEEYVRVSKDRGVTWEPSVRVTADPADSWAPSVVVRGRAIFLAWFDRRVAGLSDTDVEEPLDAAMALIGLPPHPAPPRDPLVYYLPGFQKRIEAKQRAIRTAAPAWVGQGGDPARLEALLRAFEARRLAWTKGWGIFLARSPDLGTSWEPARLVSTPGGPALRPSLDVSPPHLHLAWFDGRHGDDEIYYRHSADAGTTLGPEQRVTEAAGVSRRPSLAAFGRSVHLLWMDDRAGEPRIWYRRGVAPKTPPASEVE
jgi:hypothetical protein